MTNEKMLRLPSFIHVGPPRTGTTWLHEVLKTHVALPREKETRFFDVHYDRGIEWYSGLFGDRPADVPAGEMGPTYFSNAIARERIKHHIPDCKIIVTFREPAARLYSLYRLIRSGGHPAENTFEGYARFQVECGGDLCDYATQLKRWQATFGKPRVLALFYDDLDADPQRYLDSVCDFVGAKSVALNRAVTGGGKVYSAPSAAHSNPLGLRTLKALSWASQRGARPLIELGKRTALWKSIRRRFVEDFPPLSEESAEEIRAMMLPETEELERITLRDLSSWKPRALRKFDDGRASVRSQAG